jgi:hypothetical protein
MRGRAYLKHDAVFDVDGELGLKTRDWNATLLPFAARTKYR